VKVGESETESEWEYASEHSTGVVYGKETKEGREAVLADVTTKRNLRNYTVNGEDNKAKKRGEFEWPRLPKVRALLTEYTGREMLSGRKVPDCKAWESYMIMALLCMIPDDGLRDGQEVKGDLVRGEKYGTYELKCERKRSEDGKSPHQWILTGKASAAKPVGKVTIDDYSAKWTEGKSVPEYESYTVRIEQLTRTGPGETKTEITRKVQRELADYTVLDGDALEDATTLYDLTRKAFEAMSKCDLTQDNVNKTPEKLKVAAVKAFWEAVSAGPRQGAVSDALWAWFFNASVYIMPKVGAPAKPVMAGGWINTKGIDYRDLRGKVVIIEFWSMGCPPCKQMAPHLDQLYRKYKGKGLEIISFALSTRGLQAFVSGEKLTYPIPTSDIQGYIFDQNGKPWLKGGEPGLCGLTGISYQGSFRGIPHAFLVDRKGILRWQGHPGAMDTTLKKLLKEK
jgi:thiol-disulfide isomerase/thioredoxin